MYEVRYFVRGSQRTNQFPENTTLTTRNEEIDIAGTEFFAAIIVHTLFFLVCF